MKVLLIYDAASREVKEHMETKENKGNYRFYSNRACEYFPCHPTSDPDQFNCLFCYCPLYALGENCGGNFRYLDNGIKDCSNCLLPHRKECYDTIIGKYPEIMELARKKEKA